VALRSIKLSPKHILLSVCLLLVMLASGIMVQIAAQPTTWTIRLGIDVTTNDLHLSVNGMGFCIPNLPFVDEPGVIPLDGLMVYEGTCKSGLLVGSVTGTLTADFSGVSGPFSLALVYTVGFPGLMSYHSEWKFTGLFSTNLASCLQNVVSDASVRGTGLGGIGLDVDLHLLRLEGACSTEDSIVWLPTFVYSVSPAPTVCVMQLGVQEPDGAVSWLPGYAYPGTPISQCQNTTEYYTDVLGRTIVIHQFNQTTPV
jgi:hypothetical protein